MDYMKLIPGVIENYIFESADPGEIKAIVTACKVANVEYTLMKSQSKELWRVLYSVKPKVQDKILEVVDVYRTVKIA